MWILATSMEMILLPLLSSACCSIQLLINVMVGAGSYAGFNKHLGPVRPYFLVMLLSVVVPMIVTRNVMSWPEHVVQLFVAFLPELVRVWNSNPYHDDGDDIAPFGPFPSSIVPSKDSVRFESSMAAVSRTRLLNPFDASIPNSSNCLHASYSNLGPGTYVLDHCLASVGKGQCECG
ncbi:hypothetical protein MHU86_16937 [Fragilaria crotonensis]|nr:hypothetical protein MHU86_16937 [Fragilaria crotonensis]